MTLAEQDAERNAHRYDIHPALLACDPLWAPSPVRNPLFAELASVYGLDAARCLWDLAAEWHHCELAHEVADRVLWQVSA